MTGPTFLVAPSRPNIRNFFFSQEGPVCLLPNLRHDREKETRMIGTSHVAGTLLRNQVTTTT